MIRFAKKLWRHLVEEHTAPHKLALAVGLGLFVGTLPLYGLHLGICIGLALAFRLNKLTVYLAANISNPLMAPFLIAASIVIGEVVRFGRWRAFDVEQGQQFLEQVAIYSMRVPDLFISCLVGAVILGAAIGLLGGALTWMWARWRVHRRASSEERADDVEPDHPVEQPLIEEIVADEVS